MEAPTTLADSLLDDLDDLSDVDEDQQPQRDRDEESSENGVGKTSTDDDGIVGGSVAVAAAGGDGRANDQAMDDDGPMAGDDSAAAVAARPVRPARLLLDDARLGDHMRTVRSLRAAASGATSAPPSNGGNGSSAVGGTDYDLIVRSNRHLADLSDEYAAAHSRLCLAYRPKFPELEELVVDPRRYRNAVAVLGNEMDVTRRNDELNDILSSNEIITISVAGSTTSGRPLTDEELRAVEEAGEYMDRVDVLRAELTAFVESNMERIAPSVCVIVGPTIAARILGLAGGLAELSRMPACNLQVLGQVRQGAAARAGMSSAHARPHVGVVGECDLVRGCPAYYRKKVMKAVASKVALAARCDFVNAETGREPSDDAGRKFLGEIRAKIAKWDEPDRAPVVKALPKPDLKTKKRRGGKRIRKMKERFEETELMKQANKRAFSKETGEYGDDAMGLTMGLLDTAEGGQLRRTAEKKKMRQANTKASRKRAIQMSSGATSGLASSMVFTPVQGLELVNPDANKDRVREANQKWFSQNAGFQSALPKDG